MIPVRIVTRRDGRSVINMLTRAEKAFQDLTPAWEKSITRIQRAFKSIVEGGAGGSFGVGGGFAPLNALYAARKRKRWGNKPILVASGEMLRSLTHRRGRGAIREVSKRGFRFGTSVSVGRWNLYEIHSHGLRPVPKRDPTPTVEAVEIIVHREILRHIRAHLRGSLT